MVPSVTAKSFIAFVPEVVRCQEVKDDILDLVVVFLVQKLVGEHRTGTHDSKFTSCACKRFPNVSPFKKLVVEMVSGIHSTIKQMQVLAL